MKRERLAWLAANPRYTRRFVLAVGRRCRTSTIKDVAAEMDLHWDTVKEIDKLYMQEQLDLVGRPRRPPSASMKSRSGRVTVTGSSSPI